MTELAAVRHQTRGCVACGADKDTVKIVQVVSAVLAGNKADHPDNHLPLCDLCLRRLKKTDLVTRVLAAIMLRQDGYVPYCGLPREGHLPAVVEVISRDGHVCRVCHTPTLKTGKSTSSWRYPQRGHLVSRCDAARWGVHRSWVDNIHNLVVQCQSCNTWVFGSGTPTLPVGLHFLIHPWKTHHNMTMGDVLRARAYAAISTPPGVFGERLPLLDAEQMLVGG